MRRVIVLATVALLCARLAEAQGTYSSREAWIAAAAGTVQTETLNTFSADTTFQGAVVPLLNMAITLNGSSPTDVNLIDAFPYIEEGKRAIDGSPYVLGLVGLATTGVITTIQIQFTSPVTGWGADFKSHDGLTVIHAYDQFNTLIGTTANVAVEDTFYGFHLGPGQSAARIELAFTLSTSNDRFGIDNLSFAGSAAPPNPVTLTTSLVASVNAISTLSAGQARSLTEKLKSVLALIAKGGPGQPARNVAAVRMLNAFILEVQALVNNGSLSASVGQALIADAAVISALLQ